MTNISNSLSGKTFLLLLIRAQMLKFAESHNSQDSKRISVGNVRDHTRPGSETWPVVPLQFILKSQKP